MPLNIPSTNELGWFLHPVLLAKTSFTVAFVCALVLLFSFSVLFLLTQTPMGVGYPALYARVRWAMPFVLIFLGVGVSFSSLPLFVQIFLLFW